MGGNGWRGERNPGKGQGGHAIKHTRSNTRNQTRAIKHTQSNTRNQTHTVHFSEFRYQNRVSRRIHIGRVAKVVFPLDDHVDECLCVGQAVKGRAIVLVAPL